jgi:hypothetical protein
MVHLPYRGRGGLPYRGRGGLHYRGSTPPQGEGYYRGRGGLHYRGRGIGLFRGWQFVAVRRAGAYLGADVAVNYKLVQHLAGLVFAGVGALGNG